ncbi:hypothetical protein ACFQ0O_14285 [Saccharopolyspora spinosporotrichia]
MTVIVSSPPPPSTLPTTLPTMVIRSLPEVPCNVCPACTPRGHWMSCPPSPLGVRVQPAGSASAGGAVSSPKLVMASMPALDSVSQCLPVRHAEEPLSESAGAEESSPEVRTWGYRG